MLLMKDQKEQILIISKGKDFDEPPENEPNEVTKGTFKKSASNLKTLQTNLECQETEEPPQGWKIKPTISKSKMDKTEDSEETFGKKHLKKEKIKSIMNYHQN